MDTMSTYYQTFLRKDIFPNQPYYADKICDIYEQNPQERAYIKRVLDWYIQGNSTYSTYSMLVNNVISKCQRIKDTHTYLDQEYQNAMAK